MNAIDFYHAHHTAVTAGLVTAVHLAHLAWPRVRLTFFFLRDNGGVKTMFRDLWSGGSGDRGAGEAALLASIKQSVTGGTPVLPTGGTPVPLSKINE